MNSNIPVPARLIAPWITDNAEFVRNDLARRRVRLQEMRGLREQLLKAGKIHRADHEATPAPLAAVDAAVADVPLGDMVSILVQVVMVADDGKATLGPPIRATGVNGYEMALARTPMRVAAECSALSKSTGITVADTSFWSLLMEVNQAITRREGSNLPSLARSVEALTSGGLLFSTLMNPKVISMSKTNQSCKIGGMFVSDREALGQILDAGEFLAPQKLVESVDAKFGVEKRGFTDGERNSIRRHYEEDIGVVFYKPHKWTRAFRIEGHISRLRDATWLMSLLAAISKHTQARTIAEPWPQFMADFTAKHISGVAMLYGDLNYHRSPFLDPARTGKGWKRS